MYGLLLGVSLLTRWRDGAPRNGTSYTKKNPFGIYRLCDMADLHNLRYIPRVDILSYGYRIKNGSYFSGGSSRGVRHLPLGQYAPPGCLILF